MCLLIAAFGVHPRYPLVLAGNRDEFHARPTAPLGWWTEPEGMLAGRDLAAGGTWLGVGRDGRLAVVTNFRDRATAPGTAPSRGTLIPGFLGGDLCAMDYARQLTGHAAEYAGFNLLLADASGVAYVVNRPVPRATALAPGLYGLSNHHLDTPWPKLVRSRDRVAALIEQDAVTADALLAALRDRVPADDHELPDTGIGLERERLVSAPFIVDPAYGTRSATAVLVEHDGMVTVHERRYDPAGEATGQTTYAFQATRTGATQG